MIVEELVSYTFACQLLYYIYIMILGMSIKGVKNHPLIKQIFLFGKPTCIHDT